MFLVFCSTNNAKTCECINKYLTNFSEIIEIAWIAGKNQEMQVRDRPVIAGAIRSLLDYKEQYVAIAFIKNKKILKEIIEFLSHKKQEMELSTFAFLPVWNDIDCFKEDCELTDAVCNKRK